MIFITVSSEPASKKNGSAELAAPLNEQRFITWSRKQWPSPDFGSGDVFQPDVGLSGQRMILVQIEQHAFVKCRLFVDAVFPERRNQNTYIQQIAVQVIHNVHRGQLFHFDVDVWVFAFVIAHKKREQVGSQCRDNPDFQFA
jgi:hypothetical protein